MRRHQQRNFSNSLDEESALCAAIYKDFLNLLNEETVMYPYNKALVGSSRALRKNMTPEEKHIWYDFLKLLPVTVKRQRNIENYILDFYIASAKIAIEIDGLQHALPENQMADTERDAALARWGITVLRYTNKDINERFHAVCEDILNVLGLTAVDLKI